MARTYGGTNVGNLHIRETLSENIERLLHRYPTLAVQGLNSVAEETMTDAKERTPVKYGVLKRSGKVKHGTLRNMAATLTFGTEYAVFVHERTELQHQTGEAKFLERALQFAAVAFPERVAAYIKSGGGR